MSDAVPRTPGLYLRAVETEAPPPARTALTAFVGVTERGPLDSPQIVASFGDFVTVFGNLWQHGATGASVYAFFLNGGEEAVIVRVARQSPLVAPTVAGCVVTDDLATAAATTTIVDANGAETLHLMARNPGSWGNSLEATVSAESARPMDLGRLTASAAGGAPDVIVDDVYDYRVGGTVRLAHASNLFLKSTHRVTAIDESSRRLTLDSPVPMHGYPSGSTLAGPGFRVTVSDGARSEAFDNLSMNPTHPRFFVDVINGPEHVPYLDLARQGHSLLVVTRQKLGPLGQSRFKPIDAATKFAGGGDGRTCATGTLNDAANTPSLLCAARGGGRAGAGLQLTATPFAGRLSLAVPPQIGGDKDRLFFDDISGWTVGDTVTLTDAGNPAVSESATINSVDIAAHEVRLTGSLVNDYRLGSTGTVAGRFNLVVRPSTGQGEPEEFFNLSLTTGPQLFSTAVNGVSQLVCLSAAVPAGGPPVGSIELTGGTDPDEVPLPAFTGYAADGTLFQPSAATAPVGMAALEAVTAVNLVATPDLVRRADLTTDERAFGQTQVLYHCQKMGERFALLDVPTELSPEEVAEWPERFSDARFARYGALYYPWLRMAIAGSIRRVPPSGVMAGVFARVDRQDGVGKAPANVLLKGAVSLDHDIDTVAQSELNDAGVNCIRKFEVGALRLWGARTLSRDDQYRYVHNRRVVLLVIKGLSIGLRWAVFEPNDSGLRKRVKTSIEGLLRGILARSLPSGGRIEDAFFVNVGDDVNTTATSEAGQLIAEVGIAVAKPAEFIVITVKRTPDILTLVEEET